MIPLAVLLLAACVKPPAPVGSATKPKQVYLSGTPEDLFVHDSPDPSVLFEPVSSSYYAYSTNTHVPDTLLFPRVLVMRSTDTETWEILGDALGDGPAWATGGFGYTWSPSVVHRPANDPEAQYVMYHAAREAATGLQCITQAVSATPAGPFIDTSTRPFVCQHARFGSIDPSVHETPSATSSWSGRASTTRTGSAGPGSGARS